MSGVDSLASSGESHADKHTHTHPGVDGHHGDRSEAPSYRANSRLFDEFKNNRLRAAATSLQQRFASSITALNKFEHYQRAKEEDGSGGGHQRPSSAAGRHEESQLSFERSVMKPKINPVLFSDSTPPPPVVSARLMALVPPRGSAAPSPYTSPPRRHSIIQQHNIQQHLHNQQQQQQQNMTLVGSIPQTAMPPQEWLHENEHISYASIHPPAAQPPPLSPIYLPQPIHTHVQPQVHLSIHPQPHSHSRPPSVAASRVSSRRPSIVNEAAAAIPGEARIRHIEKAMEQREEEQQTEIKHQQQQHHHPPHSHRTPTFEPQPAPQPSQPHPQPPPRPPVQLTSAAIAVASESFPISRPLSVSSGVPRESPPRVGLRGNRSRSRSRRRKKSDALPSHVTRILEIQSANAARAGYSDDDSDDDTIGHESRRKWPVRIPNEPDVTPTPKIGTYKENPKPTARDEIVGDGAVAPTVPAPTVSAIPTARVPIHRLAETLLAADRDDSREFIDAPTPHSYIQQAYHTNNNTPSTNSLVDPSAPSNSNVHIYLHPPLQGQESLPASHNSQALVSTTRPNSRLENFAHSQPVVSQPVYPHGVYPPPSYQAPPHHEYGRSASPVMPAHHATSWNMAEDAHIRNEQQQQQQLAQQHYMQQYQFHQQQQYLHQQSQSAASHRREEEIYRDTMAYARASAEVDADAEFDILQSLLTEAPQEEHLMQYRPSTSAASYAAPPPPLAPSHPRQSIDNYHFPPTLYDSRPDDGIITTIMNTVDGAPTRSSDRKSAPPSIEPFLYTQTIYQPDLQTRPNGAPLPLSAWPDHHSPTPYGQASVSVPARSFFQPNEPAEYGGSIHAAAAERHTNRAQQDLSHYPPVLRQQLQQRMNGSSPPSVSRSLSHSVSFAPPELQSSFSSPGRSRASRSPSPQPHSSPNNNLSNSVLMSPTRLAAYLKHYLHHRTQVEPTRRDPTKVQLTREEETKLHNVIVELNSLRSAHELSKEGQHIITSLKTSPDAVSTSSSLASSMSAVPHPPAPATPAKSKSRLTQAKQSQPNTARRVAITRSPPSVQAALHKADAHALKRSQAKRANDEARLTNALVKIAAEKMQANTQHKLHVQSLRNVKKPTSLDTGIRRRP